MLHNALNRLQRPMKSIHHVPLPALSCLYAVLLVTVFSYSCSAYSKLSPATQHFKLQQKDNKLGAIGLSPKGKYNSGREALSSAVQRPKTTRAFDDLVWGHQDDLVSARFTSYVIGILTILIVVCYCVVTSGGGRF